MGDHCGSCWAVGCIIALPILYFVFKYIKKIRTQKKHEKWNLISQNKVILHGMYGGNKLPSPSPFVLKLETFLRMAKIPYEVDKTDPFGPKGKTPWISFKGEHMGDSQFIIEFLEKKFETNFGQNYSDEQKGIGTAVRVMLEEHVYWGGVLWRFVYGGRDTFNKVLNGNEISFSKWLLFKFIGHHMKKMAWSQGLGRHTEEEVNHLMLKDVRAVSSILGNKKYILGNEMTSDDCAIFANLAAGLTGNSPIEKHINKEFKNIKEYCLRIKNEQWPEWDQNLFQ